MLDFYVARAIANTETQRHRKFLLLASILSNLSVLGFFKYYDFFAGSTNSLISILGGSPTTLPFLNLILPIGISFYTFQSMCYVIDVYHRTSDAHANLLSFAGYVTLFPHQISGPLVRHNTIVPQLEAAATYVFQAENFWRGCYFFIIGLAKKMMIADLLAAAVDPLIHDMASASNLEAILAMFGYTFQLYFDFSGYSDMAVGLGLMMNIQFPQNFNSPYKSKSITEFWQRWHISLSAWLRDYLYISMGGNKEGKYKTYRNLLLTMVIGGLWHGANWTYILWGLFHGLILVIEKFFKGRLKAANNRMRSATGFVITFVLINLGWVLFRSANFQVAALWLKKVFLLNSEITWTLFHIATKHKDRFFLALVVGGLIAFFGKNTWQFELKPNLKNALILAFLFSICLMYMGDESPFLYFQF